LPRAALTNSATKFIIDGNNAYRINLSLILLLALFFIMIWEEKNWIF